MKLLYLFHIAGVKLLYLFHIAGSEVTIFASDCRVGYIYYICFTLQGG